MKRSTGFGIIVLAAAAVDYWQYPEQVQAYIPGLKSSADARPSGAPGGGAGRGGGRRGGFGGRVAVKEGQTVRAGDVLFELDDRSVQADLSKAQAQAQRSKATLADLERQLA